MFSKTLTQDTHAKTLTKTVAYRIVSSIVTLLLTLAFGGNTWQALAMGTIMMAVGMIHYYLYDRIWQWIGWQRDATGDESNTRSLVKSIVYRITAILVTAAIARAVWADTNLVAFAMASVKFVVNLAAYYGVERLFNWWRWGQNNFATFTACCSVWS